MNPILVKNYDAGGVINARRFVKFSADRTVVQAAASTDAIIGVSDSLGAAASGDRCDVHRQGLVEVEAGDTITRGQMLTSDADGKAIPCTTAMLASGACGVAGRAELSASSGDILEVLLIPSQQSALDEVTATAAEINVLDGIPATLTAAELGILDGVTATAAEINVLDGIPATLTASELGILDGVTATAAEINIVDGQVAGATIVVGAEDGSNVINVTIQLTDAAGADLAIRSSVFAYLSDDANGDSVVATAPDGGVAVGTDGLAIPLVAGKAFQLVSESDGDIDLSITESGDKTEYLIIILPTGKLVASDAITHAA